MSNIIEILKTPDYSNVFTTVLLIIGCIVGISLIRYINARKTTVDIDNAINYKDTLIIALQDITNTCVTAINQTFVNELKKAGKFDDEAKHAAFEKVYTTVYNIVADMIKPIIPNEVDQEAYITAIIEQTVAMNKNDYCECECEDYDASDISDEEVYKALDEYINRANESYKDLVNTTTLEMPNTYNTENDTEAVVYFVNKSDDVKITTDDGTDE